MVLEWEKPLPSELATVLAVQQEEQALVQDIALAAAEAVCVAASAAPMPPFASTCVFAREVAPRPKAWKGELYPLYIHVGDSLDGLGTLVPADGSTASECG